MRADVRLALLIPHFPLTSRTRYNHGVFFRVAKSLSVPISASYLSYDNCSWAMATLDPFTTPALKPPLGVEPNFVDPESLLSLLVDTTIICLCFTTFATAARLILRLQDIHSLRLEDCQYR